jgi:chemotaxis protein CheD
LILVGHKSGQVEQISGLTLHELAMGRRVYTVIGGEFAVSSNSTQISFKTLLGSCVAMMFYDRVNHIKGMNHFLLPSSTSSSGVDMKYGLYSVEAMLNEMYKMGADKRSIDVKIAGGAHILRNTTNNIGDKNVDFAKSFCKSEGFKIISENTRGTHGRVVLMGDGFQTFVKDIHNRTLENEIKSEEQTLQKSLDRVSSVKSSKDDRESLGVELF